MTEEPENIVLLHLRDIREVVGRIAERQQEDRSILRHLEREVSSLRSYLVDQTIRLDRISDRLERLERRTGLVEEQP